MNTHTEFFDLHKRATSIAELVRLEVSTLGIDLDTIYDHIEKLLSVVGTMRIIDAALQRQEGAQHQAEKPI